MNHVFLVQGHFRLPPPAIGSPAVLKAGCQTTVLYFTSCPAAAFKIPPAPAACRPAAAQTNRHLVLCSSTDVLTHGICLGHDLLVHALFGSASTTISSPRCSWVLPRPAAGARPGWSPHLLLDQQVLAPVILVSASTSSYLHRSSPLPRPAGAHLGPRLFLDHRVLLDSHQQQQ
jgi:hypothetical protein